MRAITATFTSICAAFLFMAGATHAQEAEHHEMAPESTQSEREHVPPDPPTQEVRDMPYKPMAKMMAMDDTASVGKVLLDQLDWRDGGGSSALAWDAEAWYGTDYNKLWLKTEGERSGGTTQDARIEAFWDYTIARWWNLQTGVRHDLGEGPSRDWAAVGVEGLAPYFFQIEATAYVGDAGRTAARFKADYELLFSQRLILQPEIELNAYGKSDPEKRIGSGISDLQLALRLRYEIRREVAPYIGVAWVKQFGNTADLVRASGEDTSDLQALAGIRIWF